MGEFGYSRALTLDELVQDSCVDVVYIASANTAHAAHCLSALRAGKHVLCEKPLTMTLSEAEDVYAEAAKQGRLLMEGTFSAYLPAFTLLRRKLTEIGQVQHVEINKKVKREIMESSSIINRRSLGGGIFDATGSYTTHALCVIFGAAAVLALCPSDVDVVSTPDPNGEVDWETVARIRICGITALLTHRVTDEKIPSTVQGTTGSIEFTLPKLEYVTVNGERFETGYGGMEPLTDLEISEPKAPHGEHPGLGVEAICFHRALAAGAIGA